MRGSRVYVDDTLIYLGGLFVLAGVIVVIVLTFLSEVARLLRRVEPQHRRMEPGQVWLNLIPVFNVIWVTVTVERVAESLRAEFTARGLHGPDEQYGRRTGLIVLILLASAVPLYPVAIVTYPVALGYWISYWKHIKRYTARLKSGAYTPPPIEEGW